MRPGREDTYARLFKDILRDRNMNTTYLKVIKADYSPFARRIVDMSGIMLSSIDFKGDRISMMPFADLIKDFHTEKDIRTNNIITKQWIYDGYKSGTCEYAIKMDNIELLREIVNAYPFDFNQKIQVGKFECYKFPTMSILSTAARFGSLKCFMFLMYNNAIATKETCDMALCSGNREIIKILYQNELSFDGCKNATIFHQYEFIKWLYKMNHVHIVSLSNIKSLLQLDLIKNKEDILIELVKNERYELAKYYIFKGAKVNIINEGKTLLQIVREKGNKDMRKFLINHGALDDGVKDVDGIPFEEGTQKVILKLDPKLFGIDELEDDPESPLLEKALRVGKLTYELGKNEKVDELPNNRKEWLHKFYGADKDIQIHFKYQDVPVEETFHTYVEDEFQKQVSKGFIRVKDEDKEGLNYMKLKIKNNDSKNKTKLDHPRNLRYTWLPVSEINTAKVRIDTLPGVSLVKRKELRKDFATQVINLISQFDAIGRVSDDKITVKQAALLRQAFSDALYDIQKELFKPTGKKFEKEKRTLLTGSVKSGDRSIKPMRDKPLDIITEEIYNSTGKRETSGPDLGAFAANLEEASVLPPEYRPVPNSSIKFDAESWNKAVDRAKSSLTKPVVTIESKPEVTKPKPQGRKKTVILSNLVKNPVPPPPDPVEVLKNTQKKKNEKKKQKERVVPFEKFMTAECKYFNENKTPFKIEEQKQSEIPDYDKIFTTRPTEEFFNITLQKEYKSPPKKMFVRQIAEEGRYQFKPKKDDVQKVLDGAYLFDNDERPLEHDQLIELWDKLDIHPDSRLLMASKLCQIMLDDSMSDYHFKTIVDATKQLDKFFSYYKQIKNTLLYDPNFNINEQRAELDNLLNEYTIVSGALLQTNKELTHIIGTTLQTSRNGSIEDIIMRKNRKLKKIADERNICIGSLGIQ